MCATSTVCDNDQDDHVIITCYLVCGQKLDVPDGVSPTAPSKRGWFINPIGVSQPVPVWVVFAAVVPAILIFILLFMETQITR